MRPLAQRRRWPLRLSRSTGRMANTMREPSLKGRRAGFVTRCVAFILDVLVVSVTIIVVTWLIEAVLGFIHVDPYECPPLEWDLLSGSLICHFAAGLNNVFNAAFPFLYLIFFWTLGGQTPGKYLIGLRVVTLDGGRLKIIQVLRRLLGYWVSIITLGYGFLIMLSDSRRQGLHDRIAGTCVVYAWEARQDADFIDQVGREIFTHQPIYWLATAIRSGRRRLTRGKFKR